MKDTIIGWVGTGTSAVFTAMQTDQIFEIVSLIITIISGVVALAFTIYRWYLSAKDDGKITKEEVKDLIENVKDNIDDMKGKK